jgi:hypothetical protein
MNTWAKIAIGGLALGVLSVVIMTVSIENSGLGMVFLSVALSTISFAMLLAGLIGYLVTRTQTRSGPRS